jgi:hypothetical protein
MWCGDGGWRVDGRNGSVALRVVHSCKQSCSGSEWRIIHSVNFSGLNQLVTGVGPRATCNYEMGNFAKSERCEYPQYNSGVGNSPQFCTNLPFHEFPKIWNHELWLNCFGRFVKRQLCAKLG